mgnify:CR=1 FL=1
MKIGFIGLGNVGGKLAGSLLRNKFNLTVIDLDDNLVKDFVYKGSATAKSPKELAEKVDLIITCLPSPKICSEVMEKKDGVIEGLSKNKIWLEMSTTDNKEVKRIGELVKSKGAVPLEVIVIEPSVATAEDGLVYVYVDCITLELIVKVSVAKQLFCVFKI